MLEIFGLIFLCKGNRKRAEDRGRKGKVAIGYTLGLWFGMELIGAVIGFLLFGFSIGAYLLAFGFAVIGAFISWVISKSGVDTVPSMQLVFELTNPCTVQVFRDESAFEQDAKFYFTLNNEGLGVLENGSMLTAYTNKQRNLLTAHNEDNPTLGDSYSFAAVSGATVEIHSEAGAFATGKPKVVYPSTLSKTE
jgi:hypothetical protein